MRCYILILIYSFTIVFASAQVKPDTLTNEKVISLLTAGIEPSIIINKIKTSVAKFDVTTEGLVELNRNNVPSEVINAMINPNFTEGNAISTIDSIFLYKKWKLVSSLKDGIPEELGVEHSIQYYDDGTFIIINYHFQMKQEYRIQGKFEFSKDKNCITQYYKTGYTHIQEIIKLTNTELETKGFQDGAEIRSIYTSSE